MNKIKKLGALAMAVVMCFALAATASAVAEGEYTPSLTVDLTTGAPPHSLNFFDGKATATTAVQDGSLVSVVTAPLKNPATVTVTIGDNSYESTGSITGAVAVTDGYTATVTDGNLVVTGPATTAAGDFQPVIKFTIQLQGNATHRDVEATLHLA